MNLFTAYPFFWPALFHNLIWLAWSSCSSRRRSGSCSRCSSTAIRGTRFYQSVFYLPVVLSLAVIGFIWQLQYAPDQGSSTACSAGPPTTT